MAKTITREPAKPVRAPKTTVVAAAPKAATKATAVAPKPAGKAAPVAPKAATMGTSEHWREETFNPGSGPSPLS